MKKLVLCTIAAVVLALSASTHAQTVQAAAFNIGTGGYPCGIHSNNCFGLPVVLQTATGPVYTTLWYDTYGGANFVQFSALLGTAQGTGDGVTFRGIDNAGLPYTVTIGPAISSYYARGSGRGGGGGGWHYLWTAASSIEVRY